MFKKENMIDRFTEYVKIDTQSDPQSSTRPSTKKQLDLLDLLENQLKELGLFVDYDRDNGYIYAKLEGNVSGPAVGFLAHVDTAPDLSGKNVKPNVIEKYDGSVIKLNEEYSLDPNIFNSLNNYINKTLITTSGDTLLGADDKAGIAEIMEAITFIKNNNIEHSDIWVSFTTDEEIGTGVDFFDVSRFPVDFAYTIDGLEIGEMEFENFNAASASITIEGKSIHPGSAKNQMINAGEVANQFHVALPKGKKPEYTDGYDGFYMLTSMETNIEKATLSYIIRDHDKEIFENMKKEIENLYNAIVKPNAITSELIIKDQYFNMKEKVLEKPYIIDIAKDAMKNVEITPIVGPIRGGTDGSRLSFMGIPCPNIFTGGHNAHGRYEYVCVDSMLKASELVVEIAKLVPKYKK